MHENVVDDLPQGTREGAAVEELLLALTEQGNNGSMRILEKRGSEVFQLERPKCTSSLAYT